MEPPKGIWASCWSFLYFLPFFFGLRMLGIIKGLIFCPLVCLIMAIGNSAIIIGLWPMHVIWTIYCILRAKQLGPILKLMMSIFVLIILVIWPLVGITGSILAGAGYGLLSPLMATFDAVGAGKTNELMHCFVDGTWSTIKGSFTVVRDIKDVCFHSYFSAMDEFRVQEPSNGYPYEIRMCHFLGAIPVGLLGILVDVPMVLLIALYKSPIMLFKGWHRLIHDLIGREGPFLETACVPFAGLAILLWPLAVVGAVLASCLSSFFMGAYSAVVVYHESSFHFGFNYIISSLAIFDEYSNDVLDMQAGSCFPRYQYQKKSPSSRASSFSRHISFSKECGGGKSPPARSISFKNAVVELKLVELLNTLFTECKQQGEALINEGLIKEKDIEDYKSSKGGSQIISIGLPAYCIVKSLIRSANENSDGLLLSDNTEITVQNSPKDTIFGWFFNPLMIIKDQIKAENLSEEEEFYLQKLVLLNGNPERLKSWNIGTPPETERRRAELDALARRLQGITRTISMYPTVRRQTKTLFNQLANEIAKRNGSQSKSIRLKGGLTQMFSFRNRTSSQVPDQEIQLVSENSEQHV